MSKPAGRLLGQKLLKQLDRDIIGMTQLIQMFINQVELDRIPAEVDALLLTVQQKLDQYLAALSIGSPGWEEEFLVFGIYNWGNISEEEHEARYRGIAKKNRVTSEALWHYLRNRKTDETKTSP